MSIHEIVLPETKPETEWIRGRALQKSGGTYTDSLLQTFVTTELSAWSDDGMHGRVAMSWRFRVAPPGKIVRPMAPDVAFLSYRALPVDAPHEDVQVPLGAPTVAVEILAPEDQSVDIDDKITTYRCAGTRAIIVVDPRRRTMVVHDQNGARVFGPGNALVHESLPGFSLDVGALFARLT